LRREAPICWQKKKRKPGVGEEKERGRADLEREKRKRKKRRPRVPSKRGGKRGSRSKGEKLRQNVAFCNKKKKVFPPPPPHPKEERGRDGNLHVEKGEKENRRSQDVW